MARPKIPWENIAIVNGYKDSTEMLKDLYSRFGSTRIGKILGISGPSVVKQLRKCGISVRPRCGWPDLSSNLYYKEVIPNKKGGTQQ